MASEVIAGQYTFDPKYQQQLLALTQDVGPDDPKFVILGLRPVSESGRFIKSAVWYVGKTHLPSGKEVDRFHVQSQETGKVLPALLNDGQHLLEVLPSDTTH